MTPEEAYKLTAALAAYRILIRELLVLTFWRLPNAIEAIDGYAARLKSTLDNTTLPPLGGAASDAMAQEIADTVQDVLAEAKSSLALLLSGSRPTPP